MPEDQRSRDRIAEDAEHDPDLYGLRRSERARSKQTPIACSDSDSDSDAREADKSSRSRDDDEHSDKSEASFGDQHSSSQDSSIDHSSTATSESGDNYAERPRRVTKKAASGQGGASKIRYRPQRKKQNKKKNASTDSESDDMDDSSMADTEDDQFHEQARKTYYHNEGAGRSVRQRENVSYNNSWFDDAFSDNDDDDDSKAKSKATKSMHLAIDSVLDDTPVIEQVMDHRVIITTNEEGEADDSVPPTTMYRIKWKGLSHLHNTWEPEERLQQLRGAKKVVNYAKAAAWEEQQRDADVEENEEIGVEREMKRALLDDYMTVERVIAARQVESSESNPSGNQYLCKWRRLDYGQCTWEAESIIAGKHQADIDAFYSREYSTTVPHKSKIYGANRPQYKSKQQPDYVKGGELREYQKLGVSWMLYLWSRNENGILADEMGLGKTVQTITALNILFHECQVYGPFLVVVPLSVIHSWQSEFAKWAPEMNVVVYVSNRESREIIREYEFNQVNERSSTKQHLKFNVLVTTFELILKDQAVLGAIKWAFLAVDEAHRLKNSDSQLHEALKDFKTANRLLITGTPLQNSIRELNALIQFLMPDRFGDLEEFEFDYGDENQGEKIRTLHKRLKPFMLRRLKKDVEKSLPNKTERMLRVDLAPLQVHYYKNILTKNFNVLNRGISGPGQLSLLNVAIELKKASNHPFLFPNAETLTENRTEQLKGIIMNSGKMVLLDKLLSRLKLGGHRVLIFSQMVRILDILTDYLVLRDYRFQRLDGSVGAEQRKKAVEHFNADNSPDFVFLLSTRAGGLGLNLTTADTVIIFDSDWNPQNDLQAMARAHRIGQTKQVNVYRFISKDTVEEDIIERAKRKMILEYCVIKQMDTSGTSLVGKEKMPRNSKMSKETFSKDELSAVLKFGAQNMFKDETNRQKLDDMDLDEILARAEEHASAQNEAAVLVDGGEDLFAQFQVSDYGGTAQLTWEDIIPEDDRKLVEEEERKQREDELRRQEEELLQRKIKRSMAFSGMDMDSVPKEKKKRKAPTTKKGKQPSSTLIERDIRALARAICKFGDPELCRDAINAEAGLMDKNPEIVMSVAQDIIAVCEEAVGMVTDAEGKPSKAITVTYQNVPINATQLVTRVQDLGVLHRYLTKQNLDTLRLSFPLKPVSNWTCPWTPKEDTLLMVGVYRHGFGNWMKMREDPSLCLGQKLFLDEEGKDKIPRQEHLNRRAEYVLRVVREKVEPATLSKAVKVAKSKLFRAKASVITTTGASSNERVQQSDTKSNDVAVESDLSDSSEKSSSDFSGSGHRKHSHTKHRHKEVSTTNGHSSQHASNHSTTLQKTESGDNVATINTSTSGNSTKYKERRRRDKDRERQRSRGSATGGTDFKSPDDMASDSELDYRRCKDILRPCKAWLKELKYDTPKEEDNAKKVALISRCMTAIGAHLEQRLQERVQKKSLDHSTRNKSERDLWRFVSEWFPNNPGWRTVKQLYVKLSHRHTPSNNGFSNYGSLSEHTPPDMINSKADMSEWHRRHSLQQEDGDGGDNKSNYSYHLSRSGSRNRDRRKSDRRERSRSRDRDRGREKRRHSPSRKHRSVSLDREGERNKYRDKERRQDQHHRSKDKAHRKNLSSGGGERDPDRNREREQNREGRRERSKTRERSNRQTSQSPLGRSSKREQYDKVDENRKRRKVGGL